MRQDPYIARNPIDLIRTVRSALNMSILLAETVSDEEVRWRQLMTLEQLAIECMQELGHLDEMPCEIAPTRGALIDRLQVNMMYALSALKLCEESDRAQALLADLAEKASLIQEQLHICMLWELDDRNEARLN